MGAELEETCDEYDATREGELRRMLAHALEGAGLELLDILHLAANGIVESPEPVISSRNFYDITKGFVCAQRWESQMMMKNEKLDASA